MDKNVNRQHLKLIDHKRKDDTSISLAKKRQKKKKCQGNNHFRSVECGRN